MLLEELFLICNIELTIKCTKCYILVWETTPSAYKCLKPHLTRFMIIFSDLSISVIFTPVFVIFHNDIETNIYFLSQLHDILTLLLCFCLYKNIKLTNFVNLIPHGNFLFLIFAIPRTIFFSFLSMRVFGKVILSPNILWKFPNLRE